MAVLNWLDELVAQSLVVVESAGAELRYRLLETIRAYALEQLRLQGEAVAARDRHCAYYAQRLADRTEHLLSGALYTAEQELAADLDNIRVAWDWAIQRHVSG